MFEALSDRFEGIFKRLRNSGRLTEAEVDEVLREIRVALLEADVNVRVVRSLQARIRERCVGVEVGQALTSAQFVIKVVNEELTTTLGGETISITYASKPPTVVLMAGLQGSGKTTGADLQRPAAVEQLRTLAGRIDVPVYSEPSDPVSVAAGAIAEARRLGRDVVIVDTAGRLAVDAEMMEQVRQISEATQPDYTFLVIDAMLGQDAVNVAESFHATLALDGVILTKLDGDARGGAALSVKEVVGRPIAFASTGEKLDEFDLFHPDRLAGRILGMGDVLSLIEKAEQAFDAEQAEVAAQRLIDGSFTFDDFLEQMNAIRKMGPLQNIIGMLPGIPKEVRDVEIGDREVGRVEAIIRSMTVAERADPDLIDTSRRQRIANGSGSKPAEVAQLVTQFKEMRKLMNQMGPGAMKRVKKKTKKGKSKRGPGGNASGRTTQKGTQPQLRQPYRLPGLDPVADQLQKAGIDFPGLPPAE